MTHNTLEELKLDLAEYEEFHKISKRPQVQEVLSKEIDKLRKRVHNLEKAAASGQGNGLGGENSHVYQENITNYAWDQSDKFLKLYLTLNALETISDENVMAEFSVRSVTVKVQFSNKICQLHIARLCEDIVSKDCYCKKKSDYVLVMLKKADVGKTWQSVTEREKKAKEKDKPKFDENEDPSTSITNMLKNMYDEGDDEMKRSISKAWYQSQTRQAGADFPDL